MLFNFREKLNSSKFLVTAEVSPPKGTKFSVSLEDARQLKGIADAINVTDNQCSIMHMSPIIRIGFPAALSYRPLRQCMYDSSVCFPEWIKTKIEKFSDVSKYKGDFMKPMLLDFSATCFLFIWDVRKTRTKSSGCDTPYTPISIINKFM